MEDIDGGLHPSVDEQSLDEDEEKRETKKGLTDENTIDHAIQYKVRKKKK